MLGFRKSAAQAERKASAVGRVVAMASQNRVAWSPRDVASLTKTGFTANPVGFRAVKLIAEAAAALPLICQDSAMRYSIHPMLTRLDRPNPVQGRAEFLEAIYVQMLLSGNGYIEAVRPDGALPQELYVLRADRMSLALGQDGWPVAFDYAVGGRKHRFEADVICHIRAYHPADDHYGLAPIQAAAMAMDVHNAATKWSKGLLDNAARPSGAIVYRGVDGAGNLTAEQFDRLQEELESHHSGARNAGRPMLLDGGLDWKPMGFSPSDMEFHQTKEAAAREIALAFGVPPMLLGIPGEATYANYTEAHRAFYRLTVLPLAAKVLAALSQFMARFDPQSPTLSPDLDQIPALSAEREAQWRRIAEADFLTLPEKRALLGLPELQAAPSQEGQ